MVLTALSVMNFVDVMRDAGLSTPTILATGGGMGARTQTAPDAPDALSRRSVGLCFMLLLKFDWPNVITQIMPNRFYCSNFTIYLLKF